MKTDFTNDINQIGDIIFLSQKLINLDIGLVKKKYKNKKMNFFKYLSK